MNLRNDKNRIFLRLTSKEKDKFNDLFNSLQEQCNISPKRQSEIIIEGFFQYAEHLLTSYIPHTQTKSQSLTQERKDAIFSIINKIEEKGYMFYQELYSDLIYSHPCFDDVKIRTKSSYFQNLLTQDEIFFIHLPYYTNTNSSYPLVAIHKKSPWFFQLKDLCFSITDILYKTTHDQMNEAKLKNQIFMRLKRKAKYKSKLDIAEKTMLNAFLYQIGQLEDKPMYDQDNFQLKDIIELRSQRRYDEANDILKSIKTENLIKKEKIKIEFDSGMQFLEGLESVNN